MLAARNPVIFRKEKTTINSNLFFLSCCNVLIAATVTSRIFTVKKQCLPGIRSVAYLSVPGLVMSRSCGQSPARDGPDNFQAAFPGRVDRRAERRRPLPRTPMMMMMMMNFAIAGVLSKLACLGALDYWSTHPQRQRTQEKPLLSPIGIYS